jgi:ubiquinone/menaquinone biosynthesis C-methylase UbiE
MNAIHRWLCQSASWKAGLEKLLPWALEGIDLGDHVLEIGPGPGLTTDLLRTRVSQITALEVDPLLADSLKLRMANTNVRVMQGDATDMPFDDEQFSAVVSFTMLHHVPSAALQDKLLAEARRVLRDGGVFAGVDSLTNLRFRLIHIGDTMTVVDPDTFGARLEIAGFTNPRIDKVARRFRFQTLRA